MVRIINHQSFQLLELKLDYVHVEQIISVKQLPPSPHFFKLQKILKEVLFDIDSLLVKHVQDIYEGLNNSVSNNLVRFGLFKKNGLKQLNLRN